MTTFNDAAESFIQNLTTSSNRARPKTIASYRSIIRVHLAPRFSNEPLESLAQSNNLRLKELICDLRSEYAPASIQLIALTFRSILESPRDTNGLPIYTLRWEPSFYDAPAIVDQKQPTVTPDEVRTVVSDGPDSELYLLLAASGLRISEALNLRREHYADGAVRVVSGKTVNAQRTVDLHPSVAAVMDQFTASVKPSALIFPGSQTALRERIRVPGFHSLRRFRESVLQRSECRALLINYWIGHADRDMASRYARQLLQDREYRREWATKVGLGR